MMLVVLVNNFRIVRVESNPAMSLMAVRMLSATEVSLLYVCVCALALSVLARVYVG